MATELAVYSGNVPNKQNDTPIDFADNVFSYQTWIDSSFVTDFNNSILSINTDLQTMNSHMTTTEGYKNDAQTALADTNIAKDASLSAANMKGAWSNLTGALSVPASVTHNNISWILNNDIADVTLSEPTLQNSDWTKLGGGFNYVSVNTDYTAQANDFIYADTSLAGFTITLPATPSINDVIAILDNTSSFDTNPLSVARNGNNIMGLAEDMTVDSKNISFELIFNGTEWRIK